MNYEPVSEKTPVTPMQMSDPLNKSDHRQNSDIRRTRIALLVFLIIEGVTKTKINEMTPSFFSSLDFTFGQFYSTNRCVSSTLSTSWKCSRSKIRRFFNWKYDHRFVVVVFVFWSICLLLFDFQLVFRFSTSFYFLSSWLNTFALEFSLWVEIAKKIFVLNRWFSSLGWVWFNWFSLSFFSFSPSSESLLFRLFFTVLERDLSLV